MLPLAGAGEPTPHSPALWHRRVWRLAVPVMLSNVSTPLVGLVDAAILGHFDRPVFLAGVALGALIFTSIFWLFGFLRMGTTGLSAQALGAGDPMEARRVLLRALIIAAGLGLALILLKAPLIRLLLILFAAPPGASAEAGTYVHVRIWAGPAILANYAILGWLLGMQRAGSALIVQLVLNISNVILSVLFVVELGWAVPGVAGAAALAEFIALAAGLALVARISGGPAAWRGLTPGGWPGFRRLVVVNANIFIRTVCVTGAFALFAQRSARFGEIILAANALLLNLQGLVAYALDGFAHAAEALVGARHGAGDRAGFVAVVRASTKWAVVTALLMTLALTFFGRDFIGLLTDLPAVREQALRYLSWATIMPVIAVWSYQLDGIFIGATRTAAMRDAMLVASGLFVAGAFLLPPVFGNHGLWTALALFMGLRGLTLGVCYPALLRSIDANRRLRPRGA